MSPDAPTPGRSAPDASGARQQARALAESRRVAMRARARRIRRSVACLALALFAAAFLGVYVQLASGHDPALVAAARRAAATSTKSTGTSSTGSSSVTTQSSEAESTESGSGEGSSSATGSGESSSTAAGSTEASSSESSSTESSSGSTGSGESSSPSSVTTSQS